MDKRSLVLGGIVAAGLSVALLFSAACWNRTTENVQPRSDAVAAAPALPPARPPVAATPTAAPAAEPPPPKEGEAKPEPAISSGASGSGRTVVAADGMSGSAPAPTIGKPVAPVDVAWTVRRDPAQATAWVVAVTLIPKSRGQRLVATLTARAGVEVLSGASAVFADPQPGRAYSIETVVVARQPADLVLGVSLQGSDERGRTITIPRPASVGAAGEAGAAPGSTLPHAPAPGAAKPEAEGANPAGVIHGEGVILQPSR